MTANLAERERDTVMLGRTHGQAAVPITFGLKVAFGWMKCAGILSELMSCPRIAVGKFLGAVGTDAQVMMHANYNALFSNISVGVPLADTSCGRDRYVDVFRG